MSTPAPMATGRSRWAFLSSLPANPTLFHASIEKREPTIAAPIVPRPTAAPPVAQKLAPKLAANASALRPMVMPSRISKASAPVLIAVRDVWIRAAVRTPRTLIQVSRATDRTARMRCGESPTAMSPIGFGKCMVNPKNTSGERPGRGMDFAEHLRRDDEDPRADHGPDDQGGGVEPGERLDEFSLRLLGGGHWRRKLVARSKGRYVFRR